MVSFGGRLSRARGRPHQEVEDDARDLRLLRPPHAVISAWEDGELRARPEPFDHRTEEPEIAERVVVPLDEEHRARDVGEMAVAELLRLARRVERIAEK